MGVKYDSGKARAIAEEAIRRAVTTRDNPAPLSLASRRSSYSSSIDMSNIYRNPYFYRS